ncbi:MAG: hypothetical protein SF053_14395 [Bacteroidia bacterium]|nr:hypothetical protein [Bacteroidia bacterium]
MKTPDTYLRYRIPLTVLVMVVLLLAGARLRPVSPDPLIQSQAAWDQFWVQKTFPQGSYDLLLLGDSRLYRGVSPAIMARTLTDTRIHNLGYSSGGLSPTLYQWATRLLDTTRHPGIVLAISPWTLTETAARQEQLTRELSRPPADRFHRRYIAPWLTPWTPLTPREVYDHLAGTVVPPASLYYQTFFPDGWVASRLVPADTARALEPYRLEYQTDRISPRLVAALGEQVQAWTRQGIRVWAFRPPTTRSMQVLEDELAPYDEAAIRQLITTSGGRWISLDPTRYQSYDGSHLDSASAVVLSADLAAAIRSADAPLP